MANEQNIIPHRFTTAQNRDEAARNGRKGGVASGRARREKKALSEALSVLLSMPEASGTVEQLEDALSASELDTANLTMCDRIALNVMRKARDGDLKAVEIIRDTVGEKPAERVEVSVGEGLEETASWIRGKVSELQELRRSRAQTINGLLDSPDLPEHVREGLSELYRYEAESL